MQYIPCNSALLAQEALFLPKKALFMPKDLQKKCESKLFGGCHPCSRATSATLVQGFHFERVGKEGLQIYFLSEFIKLYGEQILLVYYRKIVPPNGNVCIKCFCA